MPDQYQGFALARSLRLMQENLRKSGPAMLAGYMMIASVLMCGGIGFALDYWLETSPWLLVGGLLFGVAIGLFELARIVWRRG
jgi:F0F1-type ATP synthase assembly protein I